jgi:Terminase large subunit, T4likevirus-type, N-terminal
MRFWSGKTTACCIIIRGMQHVWPTGVNFAYVAPTQKQAKLVAWPYLKEFAAPFLADSRAINETELRVELVSGARIHVFGSESAENLRGIGLSGVVLDEFASMPPLERNCKADALGSWWVVHDYRDPQKPKRVLPHL